MNLIIFYYELLFFKIIKTKVKRLYLNNNINKRFIEYLNSNQIFINFKGIEIVIIFLFFKIIIDLNISCKYRRIKFIFI